MTSYVCVLRDCICLLAMQLSVGEDVVSRLACHNFVQEGEVITLRGVGCVTLCCHLLTLLLPWCGSSCPPDLPDQVLRVFKADQQSRYIMISKDTTAKEVVIQAIREFAVTATPDQYSLCEVSVTPEGVIKQRRLPDQLSKLADRIQLSGRYRLSHRGALLFKPTSEAKKQHVCSCYSVFDSGEA